MGCPMTSMPPTWPYFEWRDVYSITREVVGYGTYLLRADY